MTSNRDLRSRTVVGLVTLTLSTVAAAVIVWSASAERWALLVVLAILTPLPIVVRLLQKRLDPFEPIFLLSVSLFVLFALRPLAHVFYGEMLYDEGFTGGKYPLEHGFNAALVIAVVGISSLYIGYGLSAGRTVARRLPRVASALRPDVATNFALALLVAGMILYAFYIKQVGGPHIARRLLQGRDPNEGRITDYVTVYFLFGPFLAIPATLFLLEAASLRRRSLLTLAAAVVTALAVVAITAPRGDRLWLMLLVMSIFVLPYLRKQKRPRFKTLALVGVICFAFGITFLGEVRVPVARKAPPEVLLERVATNPFSGAHDFILGADTEMFSILALLAQRVPSERPHKPGVTLISLMTNWIPSDFYPQKPETADSQIYAMLFPARYKTTKAGTAPSFFGGLYFDSGLMGVFIGSLLFGILGRVLYEYLQHNRDAIGVRLLYSSILPFTIVLLRGNPTDTLARMSYIVLPVVIGLLVCRTSTDSLVRRRIGQTSLGSRSGLAGH